MKRKNIFRLLPVVAVVAIGTVASVFAGRNSESKTTPTTKNQICRMTSWGACPSGASWYTCSFNATNPTFPECSGSCISKMCDNGGPR